MKEFESHLAEAYIEAMPTEMFVEMQKDGSYADLETIARSHDGTRDGYDVRRDREELDKKIINEALTDARFKGQIDGKRFLEEYRNLIGDPDERLRVASPTPTMRATTTMSPSILILRDLPQDEPEHEAGHGATVASIDHVAARSGGRQPHQRRERGLSDGRTHSTSARSAADPPQRLLRGVSSQNPARKSCHHLADAVAVARGGAAGWIRTRRPGHSLPATRLRVRARARVSAIACMPTSSRQPKSISRRREGRV